ncbi:MAG TPA: tRNA epoxyqueuosine(34) reductase QueG [Tepidisphaeraceae bacterium]|jgi:epoxyqueuosine reductase
MLFDSHQQAAAIKDQARSLGFDLCGITTAEPSARRDYFERWITTGQHGEMHYLAKRVEERLDTRVYFPPAKSVICVAMNYYVPLTPPTLESGSGRVARYALGDDYHEHITVRLRKLADWMRTTWPDTECKAAVDTAPVLERELAQRAGIGWQGKNTCVIHPKIGSWIFLGEIFTSLALPADAPATDHCGTCQRCIEACPTDAITAPYQLDASKCISYLTIEHRTEIRPELKEKIGDWVFGCDICQDVCPFNSRALTATDPLLQPRLADGRLDVRAIAEWSLDEYHQATRRSATRRVKLPQFQRNARQVLENENEMVRDPSPVATDTRLPRHAPGRDGGAAGAAHHDLQTQTRR